MDGIKDMANDTVVDDGRCETESRLQELLLERLRSDNDITFTMKDVLAEVRERLQRIADGANRSAPFPEMKQR